MSSFWKCTDMKMKSFFKNSVFFICALVFFFPSGLFASPDKKVTLESGGCKMEAWWLIPGSQTLSYDKRLPRPITMKHPWYNSINRPPKIVFKARQAADSTAGACDGKTIQLFANPASSATNVGVLTQANSKGDFVVSSSGQLQVEMEVGTEACVPVGAFGTVSGNYSSDYYDFKQKIENIIRNSAYQQQIIDATNSEHINGCNIFDCIENISLGLTGQPFARDIVDTFTTSSNVFNDREDNLEDALKGYLAGFDPSVSTLSKDQSIDFLGYLKDYFDGNAAGGGFMFWVNDTLTADAIPNRTNVINRYLFALENIMVTQQVVLPVGCEYELAASMENTSGKQMGYLRFNHPEGDISEVRDWEVEDTQENLSGNSSDTDSPCYNPITRQLDEKCQELISPLPGFGDFVDENLTIGEYFNTMLRIVIGFMGIAAVVLIIFAGIRYMTADAFQTKNNAKELITNSFLGLAVIVSIWVIFNTINPDLLTLDFDTRLEKQTLQIDSTDDNQISGEAHDDARRAGVINRGRGYELTGTYGNPVPNTTSTNLAEVNTDLLEGAKIVRIIADVGTGTQTSGKIRFVLDNGKEAVVNTKTGEKGVAEAGQGRSGDKKTPKGQWEVVRVSISSNERNAIESGSGANMGAAFIGLNVTDPTDSSGKLRGIGLHGRYDDQLGVTYGCLRMDNDDLLLLAPHIENGTPVIIE